MNKQIWEISEHIIHKGWKHCWKYGSTGAEKGWLIQAARNSQMYVSIISHSRREMLYSWLVAPGRRSMAPNIGAVLGGRESFVFIEYLVKVMILSGNRGKVRWV